MANGLGVIFDMDGVLVNSYEPHLESWQTAAAAYGLGMTREEFKTTFGRTSRDIIAQQWPGKFHGDAVGKIDQEKEAAYRVSLQKHFPEMDGASDLIDSLFAAGFKLAIGSSGPKENVAVVQQCLPSGKCITATVNGSDVKHGKPDPEVFLTAAKRLGLSPSHCAVIEDAPVGVEAARRAGMTSIGITGTAPREQLAKHAHFIVDSLRELNAQKIAQLIAKHRTVA